jgi:hypothetical protein
VIHSIEIEYRMTGTPVMADHRPAGERRRYKLTIDDLNELVWRVSSVEEFLEKLSEIGVNPVTIREAVLFHAAHHKQPVICRWALTGGLDGSVEPVRWRNPSRAFFVACFAGCREYIAREGAAHPELYQTRDDEIYSIQGTVMHAAVYGGQLELIPELVSKSVCVDGRDLDERTPLMIACMNGLESVFDVLLDCGADDKAVDHIGWTVLMYAARGGTSMVKTLVERGVDVNARSEGDDTALMLSMNGGKKELGTVKVLVEAGADVTAWNKDGNTPLHYACERGHLDTVRYLVDHGADLEGGGRSERTPLAVAFSHCMFDVARYLLGLGRASLPRYGGG